MKKPSAAIVVASAALGLAFAAASTRAADAPGGADTLKQIENEWSEAMRVGNADKLKQILADDWVGLGYDGKTDTKQGLLGRLKSGDIKVQSVENGPMDVKFLANSAVAVVQGSDVEKSMEAGKDTSGKWVWMDVFEKRDGKWVAVRSQSAKLR